VKKRWAIGDTWQSRRRTVYGQFHVLDGSGIKIRNYGNIETFVLNKVLNLNG